MHPFHIVSVSPTPMLLSISLWLFVVNLLSWVHRIENHFILSLFITALLIGYWLRDVIREGLEGNHTKKVAHGIVKGFLVFVVSEISLFFCMFFTLFYGALSYSVVGKTIIPTGVENINVLGLPLLGSIVLLSSGFFLTNAEYKFLKREKRSCLNDMMITIGLGLSFLAIQSVEYYYNNITFSDGFFGSIFYATTGLHAFHVIFGVIFLTTMFTRILLDHMTIEHHVNISLGALYWHVVDIIWLLVYITYYYWIFV